MQLTFIVKRKPVVATPTFDPITGTTVESADTISLACDTIGATIYYTTDGSDPDTGDNLYSTPVTIGATSQFKAIAYKSGYTASSIAQATYTISATLDIETTHTGYIPSDSAFYYDTSTDYLIGNSGGTSYDQLYYFDSVNVPKDATITAAYLKLTPAQTYPVPTEVTYSFAEYDNPSMPTTIGEVLALSLTTGVYEKFASPYWVINVPWYTPSLATEIQDIFNRAGWVANNSLILMFKDYSNTNGWYNKAYVQLSSKRPVLHIEYQVS